MTRSLALGAALAFGLLAPGCENTNGEPLPQPAQLDRPNQTSFSGQFQVELIRDSYWSYCKLTLFVSADDSGEALGQCGLSPSFARAPPPPGAKPVPASSPPLARSALSSPEVQEIRRLLRAADLFQGQFWGQDDRATDAALETLTISDEGKTAVVVCSKNKTFENGSRQRLLALLTRQLLALRQGAK